MNAHNIGGGNASKVDSNFGKLLEGLDEEWQVRHPGDGVSLLHTSDTNRRDIAIRHGASSIQAGYITARMKDGFIVGMDYHFKGKRIGSRGGVVDLSALADEMEVWLDAFTEGQQRWSEWQYAEQEMLEVVKQPDIHRNTRSFHMRRAAGGEATLKMVTYGTKGKLEQYITWGLGCPDELRFNIKQAMVNEEVVNK